MFEEIVNTLENELKYRKHRIEILTEENDKLRKQLVETREEIARLNKYIDDKEF